jgi:hypothetical protein
VYYPIIGAHHFAFIFAGVMSCLTGSTHGVLEALRSLQGCPMYDQFHHE